MTRRNGTPYFRFCVLEGREVFLRLPALARAALFFAAVVRRLPAGAALRAGRAAGRVVLARLATTTRGVAAAAFGSGGRVEDRCTSVNRI
jgi:hypothetical protein